MHRRPGWPIIIAAFNWHLVTSVRPCDHCWDGGRVAPAVSAAGKCHACAVPVFVNLICIQFIIVAVSMVGITKIIHCWIIKIIRIMVHRNMLIHQVPVLAELALSALVANTWVVIFHLWEKDSRLRLLDRFHYCYYYHCCYYYHYCSLLPQLLLFSYHCSYSHCSLLLSSLLLLLLFLPLPSL